MTESETMPDYTAPHWHRAALVTVDMQRDFVSGRWSIPGTAGVVEQVARLAARFRAAQRPIAHIVRLYSPGGHDVDSVRRDAVERGASIAAPGSVGSQLVGELLAVPSELDVELLLHGEPQPVGSREAVIYKPRWSAFHRTGLEQWLRDNDCDTVVVAGCNLPNCPRATLFDATERDFRAVVVSDAVSQATDERLADLELIGVRAWTTADVVASLGEVRHGIALHPFGPEFADDSFARVTPTLTRFMSWEPVESIDAFEPVWRHWMNQRAEGTAAVFAVVDPVSGEFLGQVGIHNADRAVPELGVWIREDRHGRGFGRRAVAAARDWACDTRPDIVAFRYPVAEDNVASRRIAERLDGVVIDRYAGAKFPVVVYEIPALR